MVPVASNYCEKYVLMKRTLFIPAVPIGMDQATFSNPVQCVFVRPMLLCARIEETVPPEC
jgi:hypothetical protein